MNKFILPSIIIIFICWIILQLLLEMSILRNPMNYFIAFLIVFLFILRVKDR
ncbi:hypothetical protein [Terribacillus sp. JSM ZJ617]|uniref:hypothetical protein n=1 Tax=Terribacillus sp. JSM ZJ617 TaxID=3342119 RepID=UPI0035A81CA7